MERYGLTWGGNYINYGDWLWCPRDPRFFEEEKIVFGRLRNKSMARKLVGTYDDQQYFSRDNFNTIVANDPNWPLKYVLALFNSKLMNYWYKCIFDNVNINPTQVRLLPLKQADTHPGKVKEIVGLVDKLIDTKAKLKVSKLPNVVRRLERRFEMIDRKLDLLVYELYGLSPNQIAEVERYS